MRTGHQSTLSLEGPFHRRMDDIQATGLVVHAIPTHLNERPHMAREPIYTLPKLCVEQKAKLLNTPISNPQLVGLAERYLQLILAGLRALIEADAKTNIEVIQRWDQYLDRVVQAINTRVLKIQGYSPSELGST